MYRIRVVPALVITVFLSGAAGCGGPDRHLPPPIAHTPLALDPMDEWTVSLWWSNGEQLIRFDEVGSYTLYPGLNRYHDPAQRGRWVKDSYARVVLEPYQAHRTERIRVGVDRLDGRIAMMLPGSAPFFAIQGPPLMPEDGLLGTWIGARNELSLTGNRRFRLVHRLNEDGAPLLLKGTEGRWTRTGHELVLEPHSAGMPPMILLIQAHDDGPQLVLDGETLTRP